MYASAALPLIGASDAGACDCADGYRTSDVILKAVEENDDLRDNLSAAAHLIHGSPEDRFTVTYCPGHISREEIEGVGFNYGDLAEMSSKYDISKLVDGFNDVDGERVFYVSNPALGKRMQRPRVPSPPESAQLTGRVVCRAVGVQRALPVANEQQPTALSWLCRHEAVWRRMC
eukprot:COSAG04_NODE_3332_length_2922_cov_1.685198_4_plen_174_part_00